VGGRWRAAAALVALTVLPALTAGCGVLGGSGEPDGPRVTPRTGPAETREDVAYAGTSPRQTLDLYLPAGDGRTVFGLVVVVHGGGFLEGTSKDQAGMARRFVEGGFAAASVNYRLSGDAPFPAGVQDVRAAIRYLRSHAPDWGIDPRRIGVWGDSAGGYLAAMAGASADDEQFDDVALADPGVSAAVQAVVSWFGPADFATMDAQAREAGCGPDAQQHDDEGSPESRWLGGPLPQVPDRVARASVVRHVASARRLPPYLLVHGTADCTVPPGQSRQLAAALRDRDADVDLVVVEGAHHEDPVLYAEHTERTLDFLRETIG
jgi:acetyl esterase/lipase